jgi:signal transduction histidine kinase
MKLVRKLTLILLLVIFAILGVDTWLGLRAYRDWQEADTRRDQRVLGRALGAAVASAWADHGEQAALALIGAANERESHTEVRWVVLDDRTSGRYAPRVEREVLEPLRHGRQVVLTHHDADGEDRIYTYTPVATGAPQAGALEVSESLQEEQQYLHARIVHSLEVALTMVVVGTLLAWGVGVRMVGEPIRRLVAKAQRIGAGDFSQPLVLRQRDELSELAEEMNMMASRLEQSGRKLAAETAARLETLEELRHADRMSSIGQLASGIAHELGTPLNVVGARAKMILSGETADEGEISDAARIIGEQAERMTRIVRQLLDFARHAPARRQPTDLVQLAEQTAALLQPLAARRGVHLVVSSDVEALTAEVDGAQLQQALTNLVMNAVQASRRGGRVHVCVTCGTECPPAALGRPAGEYVRLEVRDEGTGIAPDVVANVFDPFFTTKPVGEGTGLGLSVAHGIASEHGGWIDVQSEPGRGSCFRICLPHGGSA